MADSPSAGAPGRLPSLYELGHSPTESGTSSELSFGVLGSVALMLGLILFAFMVGRTKGVAAGKEAICIETGWQSVTCKADLHSREYLRDPR